MATASSLRLVLTTRHVRQAASPRSFERGETYAAEGHVLSLVESADTLTATVRGTTDYRVRLAVAGGALVHRCSCPVGVEGEFCKHGVAVALAWLAESNKKSSTGGSPAASADTVSLVKLDDLRPWLLQQRPDTLAEFLLDAAVRDDRLREKLLRAAARATSRGFDLSVYRKSIDRATRTGGFIDYDSAGGFAENVHEAITPLHEILAENPAHADAVIELAEHALARVEKALGEADDSNGEISSVLSELQDLHLSACEIARPDPATLAARLFAWEMQDGWDTFFNAVEIYADVLGTAGLATYRQLAEAAWQKFPARTTRSGDSFDGQRFRLTSIMEALARTTDDLEALVAIKVKDLSHAYNYLQIAVLYQEAKQSDAALEWAERGLKAFPENTDPRLLVFAADEYHRRKRHDDALALIWRIFDAHPSLENFQLLKKHSDRAAVWPVWRERALARLRTTPKNAKRHGYRFDPVFPANNCSTLVQIFMWEKDVDAAWREAQTGACPDDLWLELASAREATHPSDALPVYLRLADNCIALTHKTGYEEAVRLLRKAKQVFIRLDRNADWDAALTRLRTTHKAKRTFIALAVRL